MRDVTALRITFCRLADQPFGVPKAHEIVPLYPRTLTHLAGLTSQPVAWKESSRPRRVAEQVELPRYLI